ncbi:hypothetical protein FOL47_003417, partial [Perkinsus chesapeaki]
SLLPAQLCDAADLPLVVSAEKLVAKRGDRSAAVTRQSTRPSSVPVENHEKHASRDEE